MIAAILNVGVPAWAHASVAFLVSASLKGTVLLGLAALIALWLRRASAAARHLVWTLGVLALLLVPPLAFVLPAWRISLNVPVPMRDLLTVPPNMPTTPVTLAEPVTFTPQAPRQTEVQASAQNTVAETQRREVMFPLGPSPSGPVVNALQEPRRDWALLIVAVWLAGMLAALSSLVISMVRVFVLRRSTRLVQSGPHVAAVQRLAIGLGLRRVPRVHVGDEHMMPMVWGLFRPVLLLPAGAARWPGPRLEAVVLHELAHVRRRDALTQFLAELARAVHWFNPLVWLAARRLYLEREHACDDIVLNAGTRASDYAGELLDLVRSLRTTRATALAAIAMARPSQLKVRLHAVLDEARSRRTLSRAFATLAALITLLLALPLAALRPFTAQAKTTDIPLLQFDVAARGAPRSQAAPATTSATAAQTARQAGVAQVMAALAEHEQQQQESCGNRGNRSTRHNAEGGVETISWTRGRCTGSARIEGTVRFTDDLTGLASISNGGLFRIEEDDGDVDRRVEVRSAAGRLEYRYRVDGRVTEFDAAGRAWLRSALVTLVRNTGFAADQRVGQLLRSGGVEGVLGEVRELPSDYVKSLYLRKLLENAELTPTQVKASVDLAGREVSSDYELAQILIALANKHQFNDETRSAFIAAASGIDSDYEQRRVLATALSKGTLRSQDVAAMLTASQRIGSDYERATLLIGLTERYKLDPSMRTAYLNAAKGISSDYEQRRVYANLMKQNELSATDLAQLLTAAANISSDYEKAQMLTGLSEHDLSDAALQRAFLTATRGLSSDYEHRRVLTSLLAKERLTPANLDLALQSATEIDSDYELAQVLMLVLKNHTLNDQQKELFMKALNSIDSQHEYGRVATSLLRQK